MISLKGDELIAKTEKLMSQLQPNERKRIQKLDVLINKEINKENKNDEEKNSIKINDEKEYEEIELGICPESFDENKSLFWEWKNLLNKGLLK